MGDSPFVSIRRHIRWGNEAPGENTSTLVLTSRAKYYVDVRVLNTGDFKGDLPTDPNDSQAINQLEWAFAGQSKSTPAEFDGGRLKKPAHTIWEHEIDSRTLSYVSDEGYMYPQEDGSVLEKGAMAHPETGLITNYEEVWEDLEPEAIGEDKTRRCYVLKLDEPSSQAKGMVIRIGDYIEGILRVASQITVIRWQWQRQSKEDTQGAWQKIVHICKGTIPSEVLFAPGDESGSGDSQQPVEEGRVVDTEAGMRWICIEAFSF